MVGNDLLAREDGRSASAGLPFAQLGSASREN